MVWVSTQGRSSLKEGDAWMWGCQQRSGVLLLTGCSDCNKVLVSCAVPMNELG